MLYCENKGLVTLHVHGIAIVDVIDLISTFPTVDSVDYWVANNCHSSAASIWRKDSDHIDVKLSAKGDG